MSRSWVIEQIYDHAFVFFLPFSTLNKVDIHLLNSLPSVNPSWWLCCSFQSICSSFVQIRKSPLSMRATVHPFHSVLSVHNLLQPGGRFKTVTMVYESGFIGKGQSLLQSCTTSISDKHTYKQLISLKAFRNSLSVHLAHSQLRKYRKLMCRKTSDCMRK